MMKSVVRWVVPLTALLVIGPLAGLLTASLRAPDGSGGATLLLSASPAKGALFGLAALALAGVAGLAGARLIGFRQGLFAAGLVLVWAAWGTTTVDEVIRRERSAGALWELAVEGAVLGLLGIGLAWLVWRVSVDRGHEESSGGAGGTDDAMGWLVGLAASLVIGGVMAWVVGRTPMKGQAVAAAVVAGLFGALAGRLASHRASALVFFGAMAILGVAGPAVAAVLPGSSAGVVRASYAGTLFPLGLSMPLDWLAGAFLGIPMGLSWAASMTEMKAVP